MRGTEIMHVWKEAPTGKPSQICPLETSGPTCRSEEPFPWCLHFPLLPAQPLTQLQLERAPGFKPCLGTCGCVSMGLSHWHLQVLPQFGKRSLNLLLLSAQIWLLCIQASGPSRWWLLELSMSWVTGLCKNCTFCGFSCCSLIFYQ